MWAMWANLVNLGVNVGKGQIDDAAIKRFEQAFLVQLIVHDLDLAVLFRMDGVGNVLGVLVHGD